MSETTYSGVGLQTGPFTDCHIVAQAIPAPAAGADFVVKVPGSGGIWELVAVRAQLVTSNQAANRFVAVVAKDGGANELYRCAFDTAIIASKTLICSFTPAVTSLVGGVTNTLVLDFPLPTGPYLPNFTIESVTTAIDGADQWSAVKVWWRGYFPDFGAYANE